MGDGGWGIGPCPSVTSTWLEQLPPQLTACSVSLILAVLRTRDVYFRRTCISTAAIS